MSKMLFPKMAVSNIRKNKKLYVPYIITAIFTVMMFFMNISIVKNKNVAAMRGGENVVLLLQVALVVSFIFSAVFLFYTNSFLMKRRTKEIGLYNILGMEKKHISLMMLFENVIITIISLIAGIVFGIIFSRLMFLVLMKLIKADSVPAFVISTNAVVVTIIYFISIFAVIFIYNFVKVQMSKPIELLHSDEIGEKEPKTKLIMTILGLLCLGGGYYFALTVSSILKAVQYFFVAALFVVIGTYLLFTAGSIALLKLLRKNKRFYYKTGHFTAVSGMLYRMKQNAIGLANICVLSTIVLIAVASTVSLYAGMQDSLNTAYPSEQNIVIYGTDADVLEEAKDRIYDCIDAHNAVIKKDYSYKTISVQGLLNTDNTFYTDKDSMSRYDESMLGVCQIMTLEDFNKLYDDSYVIDDKASAMLVTKEKLDSKNSITINNSDNVSEYKLIDVLTDDEKYFSGAVTSVVKAYMLIVKDMDEMNHIRNLVYGNSDKRSASISYNIYVNTNLSEQDSRQLSKAIEAESSPEAYVMCDNRYDIAEELTQLYGGLLFLGCYIGILFLMATVLIIYYKLISEGYEDRRRFEIMMKVGMSREEVKRTIKSQILMVFFIPIAVAAIHVIVSFRIIKLIMVILSLGSNMVLFVWCTLFTVIVFCIIYALVYALTAKEYYNIVQG